MNQDQSNEAQQQIARLQQQLKDANRELEMLAYSVSHDMRAPLRAIKGFSEALQEDYGTKLDEEAKRYLDIITTSTNQIYRLMDGILNYSRLGRQEMHPAEVNMTDLVRGLFAELQAKYPGRKIEFRLGTLPNAHCDMALTRQIWWNLIDNAIKFTGPRETALVEIGGKEEPGESTYFVKDNGVGFNMKYAEKLFGMFQRFHKEEEFPGAGVGLSITQRLVRRHGGRIWADATGDQGAVFWFSLPK